MSSTYDGLPILEILDFCVFGVLSSIDTLNRFITNHRTLQKVLMCHAHIVYSFLYLNLNKKIFVVSTAVSTLNLVDLRYGSL